MKMKKLRIFSILLLLVSTGVFLLFQVYTRVVKDDTPPVVRCESEELHVSVTASEEELLKDVEAIDKRSGDVSDTLVVESVSGFTDENTRVVTYAAVDKNMNVGRCERTLVYTDYQEPKFNLTAPLCFREGSNINILSCISAESVLDGSLTSNIKYSLEKTVNTSVTGYYPVEFRVMDSGGKTVYLNAQVEIYSREYSGVEVQLKEYLLYLKTGDAFNPAEHYVGSSQEGTLQIQSDVDTSKAGTYYVDYIVTANTLQGKSRLVVVVQ